jgi:hypothetical protein
MLHPYPLPCDVSLCLRENIHQIRTSVGNSLKWINNKSFKFKGYLNELVTIKLIKRWMSER